MKIAIAGTAADTSNYVSAIHKLGFEPLVTLDPDAITGCGALLLPGGGDITPAFFGEENHGSRNIDTRLDILQMQALARALERRLPVLGICKGMQLINVSLKGTILQHLASPALERHSYDCGDKYHPTVIREGSWLHRLYGGETMVNSAHHQAVGRLGEGLCAIQTCPQDGCIEAVIHKTLPLLGVQWHPERIDREKSGTDGSKIFSCFFRNL